MKRELRSVRSKKLAERAVAAPDRTILYNIMWKLREPRTED